MGILFMRSLGDRNHHALIRDPVKFLIPVVFLIAFSYLGMGSDASGTGFLNITSFLKRPFLTVQC